MFKKGLGSTSPESGAYHIYDHGTAVSLTATNAPGWEFDKWVINGAVVIGSSTTITMNNHTTAVAHFMTPTGDSFLTLPFTDPGVIIQQTWRYSAPIGPNPDDRYAHNGIDYIKGAIGQSTWETFDVLAAAEGVAMRSSGGGYGDFVLIRHSKTDGEDRNYFTLYGHLGSIEDKITVRADRWATDYENWTPVSRGQKIGTAGATGVKDKEGNPRPDWIHLHFEVQRGGYAQNKVDPYDIYKTRLYYPGGNNYTGSGSHSLWLKDPLREMEELRGIASGETMRVARTGGLGLRLRVSPDLGAAIVSVMPEGSEITVVGGPQHSGGYDWWQINYDGQQGWAAGSYLVKIEGHDPPGVPTGLGQFRIDGTSVLAGGELKQNRIVLKGNVSQSGDEPAKVQVEVRGIDEAFSRTTHDGSMVSGGRESSVIIPDLANGEYQWRARTVTAQGMSSDWVRFSSEPPDFVVSIPPTLSAFFSHDPIHPLPGTAVNFSAAGSTPIHEIETYKWEFEDDATIKFGQEVNHEFASPGDYIVTLTVTTIHGMSNTYRNEIRVVSSQLIDSVNRLVDNSAMVLDSIQKTSSELAAEADFFMAGMELTTIKGITNLLLEAIIPSESAAANEFLKIGADRMAGEIHNTSDYFQKHFTPLIREEIEDYKNELEQLRSALLDNWPDLNQELEEEFISNLNWRIAGNLGLGNYYFQKTNLPLTFAKLKREDETSWSWKGAKAAFTVGSICAKAAAANYVAAHYAGVSVAKYLVPIGIKYSLIGHNIFLNFDSMIKDAQMGILCQTGANDASIIAKEVFENTKNGLLNVEKKDKPKTPQGKIQVKQMVEEKNKFLKGSYCSRAYAEVNIHNKGDTEASFWITAFYDENHSPVKLLSLPWGLGERTYKIGVISGVADINLSGNSALQDPVILDFLNEDGGEKPSGITAYNLFARTEDGIYLLDTKMDPQWYKLALDESHKALALQSYDTEHDLEEVFDFQLYKYPIRATLEPENIAGEVTGDYLLTISVNNPFEDTVMARVIQDLPPGMDLISSGEGLVKEGRIFWELELQPHGSALCEVLLRLIDSQDEPHMAGAILELYDNINDEWQNFTALPGLIRPAFNDSNLIEGLSAILGKPPAEITFGDLTQIASLDLSTRDIVSAGGLEYLYNLQVLDLRANELTSIFPLRNIAGLKSLDLSSNQLTDVYGLEELIHLDCLDLTGNRITEISALAANSRSGGLGEGAFVDLRGNPLDLTQGSQALEDIQTLIDAGATVDFDFLKGDLNLNGVLDLHDALVVLRHAAGLLELTDFQKKIGKIAADADNGDINVADALMILRVIVARE
jgi:hypothetical protein